MSHFFLAIANAQGVLDHAERLLDIYAAVTAYYNALTPPLNDMEAETTINAILKAEMDAGLKLYDDTAAVITSRFIALARSHSGHDWVRNVVSNAKAQNERVAFWMQEQREYRQWERQQIGQPIRIGVWGDD